MARTITEITEHASMLVSKGYTTEPIDRIIERLIAADERKTLQQLGIPVTANKRKR